LDIGVLGYIGIVQHKEHTPEVLSIPPGTPCIHWAEDGLNKDRIFFLYLCTVHFYNVKILLPAHALLLLLLL